jgi:hypothetical protein
MHIFYLQWKMEASWKYDEKVPSAEWMLFLNFGSVYLYQVAGKKITCFLRVPAGWVSARGAVARVAWSPLAEWAHRCRFADAHCGPVDPVPSWCCPTYATWRAGSGTKPNKKNYLIIWWISALWQNMNLKLLIVFCKLSLYWTKKNKREEHFLDQSSTNKIF